MQKKRESKSGLSRSELLDYCRACGLGGDWRASSEQLQEAIAERKKLPDKITPIRKRILAYVNRAFPYYRYLWDCGAAEDPSACHRCSDGMVIACYLFGDNKKVLDKE